ncbi:hypothetical protein MN116_001641 [Schistosoma mekongi]|uniref:UV excision repair protein RAD23 n=1 Tax=Schistosoma mekongi TaxID=38744 RepID=A0AAE2D800_SCHME|nr:hypothetical protein MN116_001641 [Schistosoma mekongi]
MKVTFKTLKQQTFVLDLQEDDLVGDVKKKIEAERGSEFDASTQKLIHSGKVMEDSKSLKDYKVTDSGFVVVMSVSKPVKEGSASAPGNPTGDGKPAPDKKVPDVDVIESPGSKVDANPQPSLPTVTTTPSTRTNTLGFEESSLVTGENFERVVQELVSMGFEKPLVIRAMRAGFNNPDRAFEYLSSGNIPNIDIVDQPSQREGSESVSPEAPRDADTPGSESAGSEDPIAALASLPQFQQMRALVQANPELLPQLIQQIGNDNADLFRLIQENEQAFLEFLNTPVTGTARPAGQRQTILTMTAEERAAVDRLKALGFPEELVIQAYYACEKNEDAAANFLLSESLDDEMV